MSITEAVSVLPMQTQPQGMKLTPSLIKVSKSTQQKCSCLSNKNMTEKNAFFSCFGRHLLDLNSESTSFPGSPPPPPAIRSSRLIQNETRQCFLIGSVHVLFVFIGRKKPQRLQRFMTHWMRNTNYQR